MWCRFAWFSELVSAKAVDPFVGMAYALARTTQLKVRTSVAVLPCRHPLLVAKQLASLAGLAPQRVLPVFGPRPAIPAERVIFRCRTASELPARIGRRGQTAPPPCRSGELIATTWAELHRQLDAYMAAGLTKFVIRPADRQPVEAFVDRFVTGPLPRQN